MPFRPSLAGTLAFAMASVLSAGIAMAQSDFSGTWTLDANRSQLSDKSVPVERSFRAEQTPSALTLTAGSPAGGPPNVYVYPLDGRSEKYPTGNLENNSATKWEGAALLVNTIVSGPENYSVAERWTRSNDGGKLTITRNVVRTSGETESVLIYANASAQAQLPAPPAAQTSLPARQVAQQALIPRPAPATLVPVPDFTVAAGTHILLRLTNPVNTKTAASGDRIYLEIAVPVFVNQRLIIPQGSYAAGTVTEAKQAGRVKGKSDLTFQIDSITLRNGVTRDLRSRPDNVEGKNLDRTEGRIEGDGNKAGDAGTVAKTTAAGTGVGAVVGGVAGHLPMGAGIGAAGGAIAGLASVLNKRGPDVVLPAGTTMDLLLDRDLRYTDADLRTPIQ